MHAWLRSISTYLKAERTLWNFGARALQNAAGLPPERQVHGVKLFEKQSSCRLLKLGLRRPCSAHDLRSRRSANQLRTIAHPLHPQFI